MTMSVDQAKNLEDHELVKLAKQAAGAPGSREAISALVLRYQRDVRWMIGRYFNDSATIDDIAQEVFCDAITGISRLKQDKHFKAWLLKITRNKTISHLRKVASRRKLQSKLETMFVENRQTDLLNTVSATEEHALVRKFLAECLSQLSPRNQSVIRKFYFDGDTSQQIANENQVKDNVVRAMLFRIRKLLRTCLNKKLATGEAT